MPRHSLIPLVAAFSCGMLLACGGASEPSTADGNKPAECDGDLFTDADCLEAVMLGCRALDTEADCWATEPFVVGDEEKGTAFLVGCHWTQVVQLDATETCTVGSVFGRCEAGLPGFPPALAPVCDEGTQVGPDFFAFLGPAELVYLDPNGLAPASFNAILGPWALIGAEVGAEIRLCGPDWVPPGPAWCACGPEACAAAQAGQ